MVDKFGDCSVLDERALFENVQVVKKIIVTKGKYKDYYNEIASSIKLGYVPYRVSKDVTLSPSYLYIFDNKVWCIGSSGKIAELVSEEIITKKLHLVYWKEGDAVGAVAAIQGPAGGVGPRGKRGLTGPDGARGERGERGKRGERGETGAKASRDDIVNIMCQYLKNFIVEEIRKEKVYCRLSIVTKVDVDILSKTNLVMRIKDKSSNKYDATQSQKKFMGVLTSERSKFSILFYKNWYTIPLDFRTKRYTFVVVVYKIKSLNNDAGNYLLSNFKDDKLFRGVCILNDKTLRIHSGMSVIGATVFDWSTWTATNPCQINNKWVVLGIEWHRAKHDNKSQIWVNAKKVTNFISLDSKGDPNRVILGGKGIDLKDNFFSGQIASLEVYVNDNESLPDAVKYSIMRVICKEYNVTNDA